MKRSPVKDLDFEKSLENNEYYQKEKDFSSSIKTRFSVSVLFIFIECLIPIIILILLTSKDLSGKSFNFSNKINVNKGWILLFSELLFSILITFIFYICKCHKTDQFTYMFSLQFTLLSIYITSFYSIDKMFYRIIISLSALLVGIFIGTVVSAFIYNLKLKKIQKLNIAENEEN